MNKNNLSLVVRQILLPLSLLAISIGPAFASSSSSLPWESPLEQIEKSITGPVAGFIALAAVAVAGGMLIFGGELNDFARRLMYIVLVAGILLGSTQIIALFGSTGATIGVVDPVLANSLAPRDRLLPSTAIGNRAGEGAHG